MTETKPNVSLFFPIFRDERTVRRVAEKSLAVLKENHPDSPALDPNGNFIVSTQITDPSFLYTMSFGLVGSNKKDAPPKGLSH